LNAVSNEQVWPRCNSRIPPPIKQRFPEAGCDWQRIAANPNGELAGEDQTLVE
jgi:hypothetical protein